MTKSWVFIGLLAIIFVLTTLWAISVQPAREESAQENQREESPVDRRKEFERLRTFPPSVWEVMQNADRYVAMSIDPQGEAAQSPTSRATEPVDAPSVVQSHAVFGSVVVSDRATREKLNESIRKGVETWDGAVSFCAFQPHHAVRIVRGDRVVDIMICFQCGDLYIHDSDAQNADRRFIAREVPDVFDEVFKAANIQVSAD